MKRVIVTGAAGFLGRHAVEALQRVPGFEVVPVTRATAADELLRILGEADAVVHLAGVNRPQAEEEFRAGNFGFTDRICEVLERAGRPVPIVFSSSVHAAGPGAYGESKREAEERLRRYAERTGAAVRVFRLTNVFGKWSRPSYNSVVATFCHNVARGLPIQVDDPQRSLQLVHVDDVVREVVAASVERAPAGGFGYASVEPVFETTLGELAETVQAFRRVRETLLMPDLSNRFRVALYGMYVSYLAPEELSYPLQARHDARGSLAEFIKSDAAGQIFVSRTLPGITRGNHFHHTKAEKFLVLNGTGVIRFRAVDGGEVVEYRVRGQDYTVLDIPPGFTHSIENVGDEEMVVLFWASEIFDPERPDTHLLEVRGQPC